MFFAVTAQWYTLNWNCGSSKSNFLTHHALQGARACACVFMYVCMCVCMCEYVYVCVYVCI